MLPISIQIEDKIETELRTREPKTPAAGVDAAKVLSQLQVIASRQHALGFGNPGLELKAKNSEYEKQRKTEQAEALAGVFKPILAPNEKFFPRFAVENGLMRCNKDGIPLASGTVAGRLPLLVMMDLTSNPGGLHIRLNTPTGTKYFDATIPIMPSTCLELGERARKLAPDAKFHLLFMPKWEEAPRRDPVLIAEVAEEFFHIAQWLGDSDLVNEFLVDKNQ